LLSLITVFYANLTVLLCWLGAGSIDIHFLNSGFKTLVGAAVSFLPMNHFNYFLISRIYRFLNLYLRVYYRCLSRIIIRIYGTSLWLRLQGMHLRRHRMIRLIACDRSTRVLYSTRLSSLRRLFATTSLDPCARRKTYSRVPSKLPQRGQFARLRGQISTFKVISESNFTVLH
jgi:hypothetical protein